MHKFLRAIGFSDIRKKDLNMILDEVVERPERVKITKDSEENEFVEYTKDFGDGIGITVRGYFDEEEKFQKEYYFPYSLGTEYSTGEQINIEKHAEKESYAGVCDDVRIGVALIFYLQNVADYLSEYRNKNTKHLHGVILSALSTDGIILLPLKQKKTAKQLHQKSEHRHQLLAQARDGDEEAIDSLTMQDMDTLASVFKRVKKDDMLTVIDTYFMPYGIESDQYSILGTIKEVTEDTNTYTGEKLYRMKVECNDMIFDVVINQSDILGEPEEGRRFKGSIWMQGTVCI